MSNLTINTGIGAMQYVLANLGTKQLVTSMLLSTKKDAGPLSPAAHVVHWDRRLRAGIGWVGTHWVPWPGSRLKGGIGAHGMLLGYHYPLTWWLYRYDVFCVQVCACVSRYIYVSVGAQSLSDLHNVNSESYYGLWSYTLECHTQKYYGHIRIHCKYTIQ